MIYALNLYNFVPGKEAVYKRYMEESFKITRDLDVQIVVAGHHSPLQISGTDVHRDHFAIVSFPSREVFDTLYRRLTEADLHRLREEATKDYIWTLYENWDVGAWLKSLG